MPECTTVNRLSFPTAAAAARRNKRKAKQQTKAQYVSIIYLK